MAGRPPVRSAPHGWRSPPVYDPETRERVWRGLLIVVVGGILVAAIIWFVPMIFDDEARARYAVATILIGVASCGLARIVVLKIREDLVEEPTFTSPHLASPFTDAEELAERAAREMYGPFFELEVEEEPEQAEPPLRLAGVDLREAVLPGADLRKTELTGADLRKTDLRHADLRGADLRGADLRGAALDEARLEGAIYDESTKWPPLERPPSILGAVQANEMGR
jgi:Pentapeptide repeats (8 copies)